MAWDTGFGVIAKGGVGGMSARPTKSVAPAPASFKAGQTDEERQQYAACLEAVERLVQVVGRKGDPIQITISGKANPGFAPGTQTQTITITLTNPL